MADFCPVCNSRRTPDNSLCPQCLRALAKVGPTAKELILWTANRARLFERAKYRQLTAKDRDQQAEIKRLRNALQTIASAVMWGENGTKIHETRLREFCESFLK